MKILKSNELTTGASSNTSSIDSWISTRPGHRVDAPHVGIVVFPGSNCDHDLEHVCGSLVGCTISSIWHRATELPEKVDIVFLPGGFAYGDYLRTGALAALSPIMGAVKRFAQRGGLVVGICNGFQVLCEAQLLPGALLPNSSGTFCSRWVTLHVTPSTERSRILSDSGSGLYADLYRRLPAMIRCPVAHGEGNFYAPPDVLDQLESSGQILFRYAASENPNGAARDIAGICNQKGNVIGLMPHPERACEALLGESSGLPFFEAVLSSVRSSRAATSALAQESTMQESTMHSRAN